MNVGFELARSCNILNDSSAIGFLKKIQVFWDWPSDYNMFHTQVTI